MKDRYICMKLVTYVQAMGKRWGEQKLSYFFQSVDTPCTASMNDRSICKKLMTYVQAMVEQWANKNLTIFSIGWLTLSFYSINDRQIHLHVQPIYKQ